MIAISERVPTAGQDYLPAAGTFLFVPTLAQNQSTLQVLPKSFTVQLDQHGNANVFLAPTTNYWAWQVTKTITGQAPVTFTVAVKSTDSQFVNLVQVDPLTLLVTGPVPQWVAQANGTVVSGSVNNLGHLILTRTDGTTSDAGNVAGVAGAQGIPGPQGPQGIPGNSGDRTHAATTLPNLRKISAYARYPSFVHLGGKILCLGDSTTQGVGAPAANAVDVGSYPAQLVARLNAFGLPAVKGLAIPAAGNGGAYLDSRFSTTGTAWSIPIVNTNPGWANIASYGAQGASTGTLVFNGSGQTVDTFAVYYLAFPGNGTVSCTVNGGAAQTINSNATAGWNVAYITCTAGTANILTINAPTGGSFYVVGVEAVGSQVSSVRVGNAGIGGAKASDFVTSPVNAAFNTLAGITLYAPDVTVIMLGINDAIAAVTSSAWSASMQSIITAAKTSGDVILMSCITSDPAQNSASVIAAEQAFGQLCGTLAASNNAIFLDLQTRLGSYSTYNTLGFAAGGSDPGRHLSGIGYSDVALAVAGSLMSV